MPLWTSGRAPSGPYAELGCTNTARSYMRELQHKACTRMCSACLQDQAACLGCYQVGSKDRALREAYDSIEGARLLQESLHRRKALPPPLIAGSALCILQTNVSTSQRKDVAHEPRLVQRSVLGLEADVSNSIQKLVLASSTDADACRGCKL